MEKPRIAIILPTGKIYDRIFIEAIFPANLGEITRLSTDLSEQTLASTLGVLKSSTAVIADLTARNPHVMFLVGCARALQKPLIYLTQHAEDFPLDQSTQPIIYGSDPSYLRSELVALFSGQKTDGSARQNNGAEDPRAKFLAIFGDLLQTHGYEHRGSVLLESPNVYTLLEQDMDLPLVQDIARRGRELGIRVKLM